jgi:hypothetical protein
MGVSLDRLARGAVSGAEELTQEDRQDHEARGLMLMLLAMCQTDRRSMSWQCCRPLKTRRFASLFADWCVTLQAELGDAITVRLILSVDRTRKDEVRVGIVFLGQWRIKAFDLHQMHATVDYCCSLLSLTHKRLSIPIALLPNYNTRVFYSSLQAVENVQLAIDLRGQYIVGIDLSSL